MKYQFLVYVSKPGFNSFKLFEDYKSAHEEFMKTVVDKQALYKFRIGIRSLHDEKHRIKVSSHDLVSLGGYLPPERFLQSLCFSKLG